MGGVEQLGSGADGNRIYRGAVGVVRYLERCPRPLLVALWAVAVLAAGVSIALWLANPTLPGDPWQSPKDLADFRDTIVGPGRYLLDGNNPYDTDLYLAAHPWAQEFNPYAPAWLLLAMVLGPLPFLVGAAIYLVSGAVLGVVLLRILLRWAAPSLVSAGTPIGLIWLYVWAPGRYTMQNSGTLLVMLGWLLVLRALADRASADADPPGADPSGADPSGADPFGADPHGSRDRSDTAAIALGVALTLLKPQFGVPLLAVVIGANRWDALWRGVAGLAIASAPVIVICSVASGGFLGFVDSVLRNLAYSTSPDSAMGVTSPLNQRLDLLGLVGKLAGVEPASWVSLAVALLAMVISFVLVRRRPAAIVVTAGVNAAILLGLPHNPYDLFIMIIPVAVGVGMLATERAWPQREWAIWAFAAVPVLIVPKAAMAVLPGIDQTGVSTVNAVALCCALLLSGYAVLAGTRTTGDTARLSQ